MKIKMMHPNPAHAELRPRYKDPEQIQRMVNQYGRQSAKAAPECRTLLIWKIDQLKELLRRFGEA